MIPARGLTSLLFILACTLAVQANSIPIVNYSKPTMPISIAETHFSSFSSGLIGFDAEAVWGTGSASLLTGLGFGNTAGVSTESGSSQVSDLFAVVAMGTVAYGVSLSDVSSVPSAVYVPAYGSIGPGSTDSEIGLPVRISPTLTSLSVVASSSVPSAGSTLVLLGSTLVILAVLARKMTGCSGS